MLYDVLDNESANKEYAIKEAAAQLCGMHELMINLAGELIKLRGFKKYEIGIE